MQITKLTFEELKEQVDNNTLNGIYMFITTDCTLCKNAVEEIQKFNSNKTLYIVNCLENVDYYMKEFGLDNMPYTIVFKDGVTVYEIAGVLYDKQINTLLSHKLESEQ